MTYCLLPWPGLIVYFFAIILHLCINSLISIILPVLFPFNLCWFNNCRISLHFIDSLLSIKFIALLPFNLHWFNDCCTFLYLINLLLDIKSIILLFSNLHWLINCHTFLYYIDLLPIVIPPVLYIYLLLCVTRSVLIIYCHIFFLFAYIICHILSHNR